MNILHCDYKVVCDRELTVNYEGSQYTIPKSSDIKLAHLGMVDWPPVTETTQFLKSALVGDARYLHYTFQIFWSKYYPTRLFIAPGNNVDPNNPGEGTFVVAQITNAETIDETPVIKTTVRCPTREPKASSFVLAPFMEVHQVVGPGSLPDQTTYTNIFNVFDNAQITTFERKDMSAFTSFVASRDLIIYMNPETIVDENNAALYFWKDIGSQQVPDYVLWHFLIKVVISDRVGRIPRNWFDYDIFDLVEDAEVFTAGQFAPSDWNGISTFWFPDLPLPLPAMSSFNALYINGSFMKILAVPKLNLARSVPIVLWRPT